MPIQSPSAPSPRLQAGSRAAPVSGSRKKKRAPTRSKPEARPSSGFDGLVRRAKRLVRDTPSGASLLGLGVLPSAWAGPIAGTKALTVQSGSNVGTSTAMLARWSELPLLVAARGGLPPTPHVTVAPANHSTVTWPATRVFPRFAEAADRLDVIDAKGMSDDEATVLATFQGLVNSKQPRVYLRTNDLDSAQWLAETGRAYDTAPGRFEMLLKYRNEIEGIVVTDDKLPESLNVATTLASQKRSIVVPAALVQQLTAAPFHFPVVEDLRAHAFPDRAALYSWQLAQLAGGAADRLLVGLGPWVKGSLRDYAVATGSMVVWLDPRINSEKKLLDQYMSRMPVGSSYLGWWPEEGSGVEAASRHGVATFAADWSENLSLLTGVSVKSALQKAPPTPPLENKAYVAMFMSDGDNLQLDQGLVPRKWNDTRRGDQPIAWTTSPALVDIAPPILRYYQRTASANDTLVCGPSGLGYTYPEAWPPAAFEQYAANSGRYLHAAGLDTLTLWNKKHDLSSANAAAYAEHMPHLRGMTVQDESKELKMLGGRVPMLRFHISYGDTAAIVKRGIDHEIRGFSAKSPRFIAVQGNLNSGPMHPSALFDVQQGFADRDDVVFVRHDHFFALLREAAKNSGAASGAHAVSAGRSAIAVGALVSALALYV